MNDAATGSAAAPARQPALWYLAGTAVMVLVFGALAVMYLDRWRRTGQITGLALVVEQTVVVALYLCRRRPLRSSTALRDWLYAAGGSWLILLLRPAGRPFLGLEGLWIELQLAGLIGAVVSLATLGRSFGIVAADRGLKSDGVYAFVRHPTYLSYLAIQLGYLLQNPSPWNAAVVAVATACQIGRIYAEERVLAADSIYQAYAARVRFRLIPGLF